MSAPDLVMVRWHGHWVEFGFGLDGSPRDSLQWSLDEHRIGWARIKWIKVNFIHIVVVQLMYIFVDKVTVLHPISTFTSLFKIANYPI